MRYFKNGSVISSIGKYIFIYCALYVFMDGIAILLASEKNVQSVFDFCLRKCAISHHKQYFQEQLRYLNG